MGTGEDGRSINDGKNTKGSGGLVDSYDVLTEDVKAFIEKAIQEGGYEAAYARVRQAEKNKENLIEYQEEKPGVSTSKNVNDVLAALRKKKERK